MKGVKYCMNKLEREMNIRNLGFRKEICEDTIRSYKTSLLFSRLAAVVSSVSAIYAVSYAIYYLKFCEWFFAILLFLAMLMNIIICVMNVHKMGGFKYELEQRKMFLEQISSEIKVLEEMVV